MGISADQLKDEISGFDFCVLGLEIPSDLDGDKNACNYGIGVGVLTVIIVLVFIALDIMSLRTEAFVNKSIFNIADLVSCGILSLLWLVGFIYILDKWDDSGPKDFVIDYGSRELKLEDKEEAVEAAIAFCFIGAIIWVCANATMNMVGEDKIRLSLPCVGCTGFHGCFSYKECYSCSNLGFRQYQQ
jgi:hypothetical protein